MSKIVYLEIGYVDEWFNANQQGQNNKRNNFNRKLYLGHDE